METGTRNVVPLSEAQRIREGLGLTAAAAAREAEKRGVRVAGQVIRSWERGRAVLDSAKVFAYLHILWLLQQEAMNGTGSNAPSPEDKAVTDLMVSINALRTGLDHFISTRMNDVSSDDLQLLSGTLDTAYVQFRNMSALLRGAVSADSKEAGRK